MNRLLLLQEIAYSEGFRIEFRDMHRRNPLLDGLMSAKHMVIALDESIRGTLQEVCVLAEEVGHVMRPPMIDHTLFHFAGYRDTYQDFWQRDNIELSVSRDERHALEWATEFLIPDQLFWDYAQQGKHEWWEWLEHFEVEDWFLKYKVNFMRTKHKFKWRDILIRSMPPRGGFSV